MKRRIFSILTALALCLGLLPGTAFAAGTPTRTGTLNLREFSASTDKTEDEGWNWEITGPKSGTLTLTNCYIQSDTKDVIVFPAYFTLTIILVGDNILETTATLGVLDPMVHGIDEDGQAIENEVCQIIQGEGTLQITGKGTGYGFGGEDLTVQSGTITSDVGFCKITNEFTMTGGAVTASGADYGLYIVEGPVNVSGGKLDLQGTSCGIFVSGIPNYGAVSVNISGGTVKAVGKSTAGIFVQPNEDNYDPDTSPQAIHITGGSLTAGGGVAGLYARDVNVTGGSVAGNGGQAGLYATEGLSISGSKTYVEWHGASLLDVYGKTETAITGGVIKADKVSEAVVPENAILFAGLEGQIYGNASLAQELTIPSGSTLTLSEGSSLTIEPGGKLVNDGVVAIKLGTGSGGEGISTLIEGLKLTGEGTVKVLKEDADGNKVTETYSNEGKRLLEPAGTLDFSDPDGLPADGADKGYSWDAETNTLTLQEGFNAEKVTLPDDAVTIVTEGESTIGELAVSGGNPQKTALTLSGTGKLTVQELINISGNNNLSLTVAADARVEALGGVNVSSSGGVDAVVTVYGKLTARQAGDSSAGVYTGKVFVGPSGELEVFGQTGVQLSGAGGSFNKAFELSTGGRFTGNCTNYIVYVSQASGAAFEESLKGEEAISIPNGYLPSDLHLGFYDGRTILAIPGNGPFNISSGNVPQPEPPKPSEPSGPSTPSEPSQPSHSPHSSGGGWNSSAYAITVEESEHGKVTSDRTRASSGSTVTLTASPDSGCGLDALTVTSSQGNGIKLTAQGGGKYTFTMPGSAVTVKAAFAPLPDGTEGPCDGGVDCPSRRFTDLGPVGTWYHEAVDYVLRNGLMNGYGNGTFGPNDNLTRAQFVQILFNREGRPVVNYLLQYRDVADGAWYTEAIRWATSQGIICGYGNGMFGPNDNITREQLAVMLWRYAGSPAATDKELHFPDADKAGGYALEALCWAVEKGVMNGYGDGRLGPQGLATRAQVAQMLKNFLTR